MCIHRDHRYHRLHGNMFYYKPQLKINICVQFSSRTLLHHTQGKGKKETSKARQKYLAYRVSPEKVKQT